MNNQHERRKAWAESEYKDFSLFVIAYPGAFPITLGGRAYVFDKDRQMWYRGCIADVKEEESPLKVNGSYTGEFIIDGVGYAVGINASEKVSKPDDVVDNVMMYC